MQSADYEYQYNGEMHSPPIIINQDIDGIIRGELAAAEAYEKILKHFEGSFEYPYLLAIKLEHQHAARFWKREAKKNGSIPEESSSTWGTFVSTMVSIFNFIGKESSLKFLIKGENYGIDIYSDALESRHLTFAQKLHIRNKFLPDQRSHIGCLNDFVEVKH